jgi:ABC-type phosphate transport system substrate-binding protein
MADSRFRLQEERNMRMLNKLIAGATVLTAVSALSMGTALADPPSGVTPKPTDVVGVGSNTTEYLLDQLTLNYDKGHAKSPQIYSYDALQNSNATGTPPNITAKKGCAAIPRPNGSSAGIAALADNIKVGKNFCLDFGRSSRARKSTDPTTLLFVPLALDNVTYATVKSSNAPTNLTTHDLTLIYTCTVTNWDKFPGGKNAPIKPILPQPNSGTLAFFETAIGVTTPGKCVAQPANLEENEGINAIFKNKFAKDEIIPFSAGKWVDSAYHSPACATASCPTTNQGVDIKCKKPAKVNGVTQNAFGCDLNGVLLLNSIDGKAPLVASGKVKKINPAFAANFIRTLFDVVRTAKTSDGIPSYLNGFFGPKGYFCSGPEKTVISNYGFRVDPACG